MLRTVRARKEVILSGGAIGSPHILMLSGVGPRKQLEDLRVGIYVILVLYYLCRGIDTGVKLFLHFGSVTMGIY